MPSTFSQFLLHNGYASPAELEEASQATVLYGGRLGTSLIELGILTPEQLDQALARHHALPEIPREWLARPDAGARAALHVDVIKRHRAFPLFFEKRRLHVGLVDPRDDLVLDNLAFASGCLIVPYALAEFRFVQLMQRVFAQRPSARFRTLLDDGAREERREQAAAARANREEPLEIGPLAADVELGAVDAFFLAGTVAAPPLPAEGSARAPQPAATAAPQTRAPGAALAPEPPQASALAPDAEPILLDRRAPQPTLEVLERTLAECSERERVIETALTLASRFAEVAALFVIRDGVAAGLAAQRSGYELDIDAAQIPISADSVLARCYASRAPQRALPQSALDQLLAKALHNDESTELAVFAVAIGGRVVNLLVAQSAQGALSAAGLAALGAIAPQIGAAYERLIRAQKQKAQGPAATAQASPAATGSARAAIGALPLQKRIVRLPAKG